jgi:NAD(P)-dependent dehydrogenase (short-subunit alcohol dehydrogenase family)
MGRLEGLSAVVTGGAGGIGRATCELLAHEGARIVVVDVDVSGVQETVSVVEARGGSSETVGLVADVRDNRAMEEMARKTLEKFGRIDILVAAAGLLRGKRRFPRPLVEVGLDEWEDVIGTNLRGTFLSNRAVLPTMIEQRAGHIFNISSTSGRRGRAFDSVYCASKFGVIGFSQSEALEVRHYGVKVHVILPDAVKTGLWEQNGPIPCPRESLSPSSVAQMILLLLLLPEDATVLDPVILPFPARRGAEVAERRK